MALTTDQDRSGDPGADLTRLLEAAARGDEQAWREVVGLYARRVFALAKSRCRNDDVAEEITQSVFVTLASKLSDGGYTERGRFESWLFRIAMNRVRDEVRRARRRGTHAGQDALEQVSTTTRDNSTTNSELDALRTAMLELNEQDREVIQLRHHGGMSFKQMSELLDEPVGTLLARHHRALRKLKAIMTEDNTATSADERGVDS